jgi:hypothetical protein
MQGDGVDVEALEARAQAVLSSVPDWIWDGAPPVPVDDIADSCFDLFVREVDEMHAAPDCPPLADGQTISGLLIPPRQEIWVNRAEAQDPEWGERRKRFTISHELGHWVLHRDGQQSLFCRHASVEENGPTAKAERPPLPLNEQEANAFAAALLLPADLVREHYKATDGDFFELCRRFNCSQAAMGRRLHKVV